MSTTAFVKQLQRELEGKIETLRKTVASGTLPERQYVAMAYEANGVEWALKKAKELLQKLGEEEDGFD